MQPQQQPDNEIKPDDIDFSVGAIALKDGRFIPQIPDGRYLDALQMLGQLVKMCAERAGEEKESKTIKVAGPQATKIILGGGM